MKLVSAYCTLALTKWHVLFGFSAQIADAGQVFQET